MIRDIVKTVLNRPREVHAFVVGIHLGLEAEGDRVIEAAFGEEPESKIGQQIRAEPWYASSGVLVGRVLRQLLD